MGRYGDILQRSREGGTAGDSTEKKTCPTTINEKEKKGSGVDNS